MITIVSTILLSIMVYLTCGIGAATCFVCWGVNRVDASARNTSIAFRILLMPGCILFWPWILRCWIQSLVREKTA